MLCHISISTLNRTLDAFFLTIHWPGGISSLLSLPVDRAALVAKAQGRIIKAMLFINHMPLPRRNTQRPPYALFWTLPVSFRLFRTLAGGKHQTWGKTWPFHHITIFTTFYSGFDRLEFPRTKVNLAFQPYQFSVFNNSLNSQDFSENCRL